MNDTTQGAAPVNPASVASDPNANKANQNPNASREAAEKDALARDPKTQKAAQEGITTGPGKTVQRSSSLISNPASPTDPDAPVVEEKPAGLPQSTIDEMAAGKQALERNRPVAQALEAARREDKPD